MPQLQGDCALAIVAGRYASPFSNMPASRPVLSDDASCTNPSIVNSDTTASALLFLFYRLSLQPEVVDNIRKELISLDNIRDDHALQTLPYLNGAITEGLRLHPPVPGGFSRQTPPEGITIDGVYIPGGVTCVAPNYSIARCELLTHPIHRTALIFHLPCLDIIPSSQQHRHTSTNNDEKWKPVSKTPPPSAPSAGPTQPRTWSKTRMHLHRSR